MSDANLRKGRISIPKYFYSITTVTLDHEPYFSNLYVGRSVILEMKRLHDEGLLASYAWVLMPDHLYWIFQLGDRLALSDVLKLVKARSAKKVNEILHRQGSVWQKAFHDHAARQNEDLLAHAQYIINNPVRKGLVTDIGSYPLWDAIWLWPQEQRFALRAMRE